VFVLAALRSEVCFYSHLVDVVCSAPQLLVYSDRNYLLDIIIYLLISYIRLHAGNIASVPDYLLCTRCHSKS
jgi:hypothetical protein